MVFSKKLIFPILLVASAFTGGATESGEPSAENAGKPAETPVQKSDDKEAEKENFSFVPRIHGALRARWELDTRTGDNRFQVRNARVSLEGKVAPSIDYYIQTDLCDRGKMKILDAWGRFRIIKGLTIQGGQFRMPFGVEPSRAPSNYIFANRSFMGKQVMNYRAVGGKVAYAIPKVPLTVEAGVFNPKAIGDHEVWQRTVAYSAKALYKLPAGFSVSVGYASIRPAGKRANLIDGFVSWQDSHWLIAGEYMYENYCNSSYKDVHSYVAFADWHMPVKCGVFNQWSVQGRFDGMTDHFSLGSEDVFDAERHRFTIGSTLTYKYKFVHADIRLNYEKYLSWKGEGKSPDRLVAELVIRF